MQNYFQREAIIATKKMIRAFYTLKNVEGALEFFSRERLTFISIGEDEIFNSFDEVRAYFQRKINVVTSAYKIVSEDYSIKAASYDSCIVVAKLGFQSNLTPAHYKFYVIFSFYFQLINDKLFVTFVQSHMPEKVLDKEKLHANVKLRKDFLFHFENVNYIAAKSFLCKDDDLPYCYVNDLFLKLLGYNKIKIENYSSLAHIHVNDQQRYFNYLQKIFKEKNTGVSEGWRWHNSYRIMYRLVNCNREAIKVLEWGNLLSLNGEFIFNSFVTPLDELEVLDDIPNIYLDFLNGSPNETSALLNDCGIHIGNILLIYPRRRKIFINGKAVALTPIEFELLLILAEHLSKILDTKEIYKSLWSEEDLKDTSFTLKTHISNLRRKLREASEDKIQLKNCKGDGYCLTISEL